MDSLPFIFPLAMSAIILFSSVPLPLAILALDTSAVSVMSLDASPRSVTEAAALSSMSFSDRFEGICAYNTYQT